MHIAVLLVLETNLRSYRHSALTATHEATQRLRLRGSGLRMASLHNYPLHLVEESLIDGVVKLVAVGWIVPEVSKGRKNVGWYRPVKNGRIEAESSDSP